MQWYGLLRQTISLHFFIGCLAQILLGSFSIPRNLSVLRKDLHCVKSVRIRSFSGPYFPTIGTNTERYGLLLRIQSECGELRTRKTPNMDTFHAVFGNKNHTHQKRHGRYPAIFWLLSLYLKSKKWQSQEGKALFEANNYIDIRKQNSVYW